VDNKVLKNRVTDPGGAERRETVKSAEAALAKEETDKEKFKKGE
jgi:hypothetical protein